MIEATTSPLFRRTMNYVNREMKIDQIIAYFNDKKINLIPPFQRGSVWTLPLRQRLIQNMIRERPIPAIFLYKQDAGSQFSYNILDGKQRLESLILFVGNLRPDMKVQNIDHYFYGKPARQDANFAIEVHGKKQRFEELDNSLVRKFREFAIPTVEIDLEDEHSSIDEIIELFIDINQEGVRVNRFDVVKALGKDPLFKQVFGLIAVKKLKKKSSYYAPKSGSSFAYVLGGLNIVSRLSDKNSRINRMWERMTEIALFARSHQHRAPAEILKAFIDPEKETNKKLSGSELANLTRAFVFLEQAYRYNNELASSKLATDQPQFYTLITTLLCSDVLDRYQQHELQQRITEASRILDGVSLTPEKLKRAVGDYRAAATKQTTHPSRREKRQQVLLRVIDGIEATNGKAEQHGVSEV